MFERKNSFALNPRLQMDDLDGYGEDIDDWIDVTCVGDYYETQLSPSTNQHRYRDKFNLEPWKEGLPQK